jgi:hypothetical protein
MDNLEKIKVVINNRNRLTTTKKMVDKLVSINPNEHIIILDNDSSYPPLLEWYEAIMNNPNLNVEVIFKGNEGHLALWGIGLDKELGEYFVYSDSDIELNENLPNDWKEIMLNLLFKYKEYDKVAFALRVDDLPEHYLYRNQVKRNEGRWWLQEIEQGIYIADTDTTFFMMRNIHDNCFKSLRIAREDLICRHAPWYHDIDNLDDEEKYYLDNLGERQLTQYSKQHKNPSQFKDI